jgi:hypothetical protein
MPHRRPFQWIASVAGEAPDRTVIFELRRHLPRRAKFHLCGFCHAHPIFSARHIAREFLVWNIARLQQDGGV